MTAGPMRLTSLLLLFLSVAVLVQIPGAAVGGFHTQCPATSRACGVSDCCLASETCSWDGHCHAIGDNYCGGGRSCPRGQLCADGGTRCAAEGSITCPTGSICPRGTECAPSGGCRDRIPGSLHLPPPVTGTAGCLPGGGCTPAGWFRCEQTGSQCRPGFKCSRGRGCVPVLAVDCGFGKWCRPGESCTPDGGCAPAAD